MERLLSGRLDPIDWATYESFLYANQRKFGARSQVCWVAWGHEGTASNYVGDGTSLPVNEVVGKLLVLRRRILPSFTTPHNPALFCCCCRFFLAC